MGANGKTGPSFGGKGKYPAFEKKPEDMGDIPESREIESKFLNKYMTLPRSLRFKIGHQFDQMIQMCTFRGRDCLNSRSEEN